ncbi:hypothetical protein DY000_02064300 [Brassica cretica]|uniref:Proteasome alpha-type subunits domain-containing protein n=1 Tax=Brassica cretica TaxID=69181 RepID=A0ABQ7AYG9_BRACR|nr:hypothetical protein DY000_02064300 [Brassica cretica]
MQCCRFFEIGFFGDLIWVVGPSGKLVQIEHALTAVGSGQTSLGIKASNGGVVIATEKKLPSILASISLDPSLPVQKIQHLTPNIGVVYSGMGPDSRLYKEPIPVTQLVRETTTVMQEFTQSGWIRLALKNIEIGKIGADKVFR